MQSSGQQKVVVRDLVDSLRRSLFCIQLLGLRFLQVLFVSLTVLTYFLVLR